jgi:beta-xylosidase/AraC-like DNA-binding protein
LTVSKELDSAPYLLFINGGQRLTTLGTAFIFSLKGHLKITTSTTNKSNNIDIPEGQISSLNSQNMYKLTAEKNSLGCVLVFPFQYCEELLPDFTQTLFTVSPKENMSTFKKYYQAAQQNFAELILLWLSQSGHSPSFEKKSLDFLTFNLKYFSELNSEKSIITDVITYIKFNYDKKIDLQNISNKFYLSNSYVSRLFSKSTGIKLHDYLSRVRIAAAINKLITTDKSIDFIATETGFNNSRTFGRLFKKITHLSPSKYRELYGNQKKLSNLVGANKSIIALLNEYSSGTKPHGSKIDYGKKTEYSYLIDCSKKHLQSYKKFQLPKIFVIIGNPNQLLRKDVQEQLSQISNSIGSFKICIDLKAESFLPQKDSTLKPLLSAFEIWDEILNYLMSQNFTPLMSIYEADFNKNLPLFKEFCVHYSNLTNIENVQKNWQFLFKPSDPTSPSKASESFANFVDLFHKYFFKSHYGISLGKIIEKKSCFNLLSSIMKYRIPIDFLDYSLNQNDNLNSQKQFSTINEDDHKLKIIKSVLKTLNINVSIYLLNWNTVTGQTEFTNGHFFRGALIAKTIIDHFGKIDGIGFWINAEILDSTNGNKINGLGISLMHYHNGKRPAFYSLSLLSRLKGQLIFCNRQLLITAENGDFKILLLNPTIFDPNLSCNKAFLKQEEIKINVTLKKITNSKYRIKKYQFDVTHGALYYLTNSLQTPSGMDKETIDYISQHATPKLLVYETLANERLHMSEHLTYNAMVLFIVKAII